jgi:hypothetical protein
MCGYILLVEVNSNVALSSILAHVNIPLALLPNTPLALHLLCERTTASHHSIQSTKLKHSLVVDLCKKKATRLLDQLSLFQVMDLLQNFRLERLAAHNLVVPNPDGVSYWT